MIILRQKQFGFWDFIDPGYSARVKRYNEQKEKDKQEIKQKEILDKTSSISPQHRVALEIEKEAKKYTWGGLDEYPYFHVIKEDGDKFGDISLSFQEKYGRYHWNGKYWEEVELQKFPKRVANLKSELLNRLKSYRKNISNMSSDEDDEFFTPKEEIEGTIFYLDNLIKIIERSSL
jgi:hypothetical protein